ncbi:metallophosphatase family protein [Acidobacteria bacterium AH-259-G07]|nr:metallophosphatase family protein [Acidobacteria bacterium AH-259-G07]
MRHLPASAVEALAGFYNCEGSNKEERIWGLSWRFQEEGLLHSCVDQLMSQERRALAEILRAGGTVGTQGGKIVCHQSMLVGVISDTHGLLRPQVFDLFRDVECIIHAGDIGNEGILIQLRSLAPVHAVYGNTDRFPLVEKLPEKKSFQLEGVRVFLTHIGGKPKKMRSHYPEVGQSDLVIFGHTHRPLQVDEGGVLFFNPGSAGPRRFLFPVTLGKIQIQDSSISAEIIEVTNH